MTCARVHHGKQSHRCPSSGRSGDAGMARAESVPAGHTRFSWWPTSAAPVPLGHTSFSWGTASSKRFPTAAQSMSGSEELPGAANHTEERPGSHAPSGSASTAPGTFSWKNDDSSSGDEAPPRPAAMMDEARQEAARKREAVAAALKPLDDAGRAHVLALHAKGRNAMQIKNNYLLADYSVTADQVRDVIAASAAASTAAAAAGGGGGRAAEDAPPKSYTAQELKEWMQAVKNKDMTRMRELLHRHEELLNAAQRGIGNTALHWAAVKDYSAEIKWLLSSKADVSVRNASMATPLHAAAGHGNAGAVTALLEGGADLTLCDEQGETASDTVARRQQAAEAELADDPSGEKAAARAREHLREDDDGGDGLESEAAEARRKKEEMHDAVRRLTDAGEVLALFSLVRKLGDDASRESWTLGNLKRVLALARIDTTGLVEKEDLAAKVDTYLNALASGTVPARRMSAGASPYLARFSPPSTAGAAGGGGKSGEGTAGQGEKDGGDRIEVLKGKGNAAFGKGEWDAAVRHYSMAIRLDASNAVLHSNRSAAYAAMGRWVEAHEDADTALELRPDWAKGFSRKAAALAGMGKYSEAVEAYKKGLDLDPGNAAMSAALKDVQFQWVTGGGGKGRGKKDGVSGRLAKAQERERERVRREAEEQKAKGGAGTDAEAQPSHDKQKAKDKENQDNAAPQGRKGAAGRGGGNAEKLREGGALPEEGKGKVQANRGAKTDSKAAQTSVVAASVGKEWLNAARKGDIEVLERLLAGTPQLLEYQGDGTKYAEVGHSAQHWCAARGHLACLQWLLDKNAQVDMRNKGSATPLHAAALQEQVACGRLLVQRGADVNALDVAGDTPADAAAKMGATALAVAGILVSSCDGVAAHASGGVGVGDPQRAQTHTSPVAEGGLQGESELGMEEAGSSARQCAGGGGRGGAGAGPESAGGLEDGHEAKVEALKDEGNRCFGAKQYPGAIAAYTEALGCLPANASQSKPTAQTTGAATELRGVLLSNRSAALLAHGQTLDALRDADECVRLRPDWPKAYSRRGAALAASGDCYNAALAFRAGLKLEPGNASLGQGLKLAEARLQELSAQWDDLPDSDPDDDLAANSEPTDALRQPDADASAGRAPVTPASDASRSSSARPIPADTKIMAQTSAGQASAPADVPPPMSAEQLAGVEGAKKLAGEAYSAAAAAGGGESASALFEDAKAKYTAALELMPEVDPDDDDVIEAVAGTADAKLRAVLLSNRAQCWIKIASLAPDGRESSVARRAFMQANVDAAFAAELAPDFAKAHYRKALSLLGMSGTNARGKEAVMALKQSLRCSDCTPALAKEVQGVLDYAQTRRFENVEMPENCCVQ